MSNSNKVFIQYLSSKEKVQQQNCSKQILHVLYILKLTAITYWTTQESSSEFEKYTKYYILLFIQPYFILP